MLTVGVFPNIKKTAVKAVLEQIVHFFTAHGVPVLIPEKSAEILGYPQMGASRQQLAEQVTVALTLGGDGTLLTTTRELVPFGIPVCGINLGQLGFLTEIEVEDLIPGLEKILQQQYVVEERQMLQASVWREQQSVVSVSALNDVVITKGGFSRLIRLKLFIDGHLTANYPADGLIVATSTGSTGYSLSAGGPIVNPALPVTIITPICPHSLNTRSLIVSEREEVRIEPQATHEDIVLTVDGQNVYNLKSGDQIVVSRAPYQARFVKLLGNSYYDSLWDRLHRSDLNDCP